MIITIIKDSDRQEILHKLEDLSKRNQADKGTRSQQHNTLNDSVIFIDNIPPRPLKDSAKTMSFRLQTSSISQLVPVFSLMT